MVIWTGGGLEVSRERGKTGLWKHLVRGDGCTAGRHRDRWLIRGDTCLSPLGLSSCVPVYLDVVLTFRLSVCGGVNRSQPPVNIPQSESDDRLYDIGYYTRDTR
jgi:hypothetical protein